MKIASFSSLLTNFPSSHKCFLIYGNNENLVYFREKVLTEKLKKAFPSFKVQLLEEFSIPEAPSLGLFESGLSSFIYLYRRATDRLLKTLEDTLSHNQNYYILAAPTLTTKSKLVDFSLKNPAIAAIPSYTIEKGEIVKVVHDFCEETSLALPDDAKMILIESLMSNPMMFESQLQKAALFFAQEKTPFSPSLFKDLFISKEDSDLFKMKEAFFRGDKAFFSHAWAVLKGEEVQDVALLRFLQAEVFRGLKNPEGNAYFKGPTLPPLQATRLLLLLLELEISVKWDANLPENYLLQKLLQWLPANNRATR